MLLRLTIPELYAREAWGWKNQKNCKWSVTLMLKWEKKIKILKYFSNLFIYTNEVYDFDTRQSD